MSHLIVGEFISGDSADYDYVFGFFFCAPEECQKSIAIITCDGFDYAPCFVTSCQKFSRAARLPLSRSFFSAVSRGLVGGTVWEREVTVPANDEHVTTISAMVRYDSLLFMTLRSI